MGPQLFISAAGVLTALRLNAHISILSLSLSFFEGATETRLPYFLFAVLPKLPPPSPLSSSVNMPIKF